jgi:hypothetical protein
MQALGGVNLLQDGLFSEPIDLKGVKHIVLLSQVCNTVVISQDPADSSISLCPYEILIRVQLSVYRNSGGLQAIMNSKLKRLLLSWHPVYNN